MGDLIADIGNTRAHLAWTERGGAVRRTAVATADPQAARAAWTAFLGDDRPARIAYATVDAEAGDLFAAWAEAAAGVTAASLGTPALPSPVPLEVDRPEQVGPDRIANAAWAARNYPDRAVVVVDLGTAITFDVVSAAGAFVGGVIACGLRLQARALAGGTDRLPLIELDAGVPPALGKTTEACLLGGLLWGAVGLIETTCARIALELGQEPLVFATGGDAGRVAPHCSRVQEVVPDLTLLGVGFALEARDA